MVHPPYAKYRDKKYKKHKTVAAGWSDYFFAKWRIEATRVKMEELGNQFAMYSITLALLRHDTSNTVHHVKYEMHGLLCKKNAEIKLM